MMRGKQKHVQRKTLDSSRGRVIVSSRSERPSRGCGLVLS